MEFTWIEIINNILKASREGDLVSLKYWQDMWDDTETVYADTLDLIGI